MCTQNSLGLQQAGLSRLVDYRPDSELEQARLSIYKYS